uniref:Coiled-coil domain-containing protein 149 n=1 Tax=Haemonchus contortus TaxID=6289 RepID=A0A7I4YYZ0_HAECO
MTPEDRNALSELEGRIAAMERRLRNARVARDSYVNFLKEKYPGWQPSTSFKTYEDTLVNRLLTSEYNWDEERDQRQRFVLKLKPRPLYENIPARGPLLTSDLERIRRRLTEISGQLRSIRETRLNLSTEDYLRSKINIEDRYDSNSSLMAIRSRLSDIALTTFEPVATPTSEQITNMKLAEEHDQYIAEPAAQIVPSRQPSVYQKMMGIFGNTNSSDTDDDISLQVKPPPRIVDTQASVAQPVVRQSSSSMLSHYLTAANSTAKDATSSDSDDDFFK